MGMPKNIEKVYVVTMYRGGNRSSHSYVLTAMARKEQAIKTLAKEERDRSMQYLGRILEINLRTGVKTRVDLNL